jgi:ABC-2 type transport system permease protein
LRGSTVIFRKELAENLSSKRFTLTFILIFLSGASTVYLGAQELARQGLAGIESQELFLVLFSGAAAPIPSFVYFIVLLAPILGIALGFDAVNREMASGSMVRLLSNPIYRDSIIIGKLVAGLAVIALVISSIVGVITGLDILLAGFGPSLDSTLRIFYFTVVAILYSGVWFSMAIFFSVLFRRVATSALASLALWILLSFFMYMIAGIVAQLFVPLGMYPTLEQLMAREELRLMISRISPNMVFGEVANVLLNPRVRTMGPFYVYSPNLPLPAPLSIDESLFLIWPHVSALIAEIVVFFILSYIAFMKMEIRAKWE